MSKLATLLVLLSFLSPQAFAMNGIFWQPQLRDNAVSEADWCSLMQKVRLRGFDTLVMQWTRYGDAFTTVSDRARLLQKAQAARAAGLKVVIGLNADPDFFSRQKQPLAALENYLRRLRERDLEQASTWANKLAFKPDGWYISTEIDDHNWREQAAREQMFAWLGETRRQLDEVAPAPVYISSFFAGNMTPEAYRRQLAGMRATGVRVFVQDGGGVQTLTDAQRELYLNASAGCATAAPASGIVYEIFTVNPGRVFSARPKTAAQINALLANRGACAKDRLYFSLRYLPEANAILQHH